MEKRFKGLVSLLVIASLITPLSTNAQTTPSRPQTAAEANAASAAQARAEMEARAAAAAVAAAAKPPANETPEERKARLKAEKQAEKDRQKAARDAEKERERAERAARPRSEKAAGLKGCLVGAALGVGLSMLFGGKSAGALIGSAAVGCIGGWKLGEALKGQDDKKLSSYVVEDYADRDDVQQSTWHAPESGQDIKVETLGESYKDAQQTVGVSEGVEFDQSRIKIVTRKLRTRVATTLRSSMDSSSDANIVGQYDANEFVQAFGDSTDGKWTYIGERQADGSFVLIGYLPSAALSSALQANSAPIVIAKPKPKTVKAAPSSAAKRAGPAKGKARANPVQAAPTPVATPAPMQVASTGNIRKVSFTAPTRCKSVRVSALGKSDTKETCGGARSIA